MPEIARKMQQLTTINNQLVPQVLVKLWAKFKMTRVLDINEIYKKESALI